MPDWIFPKSTLLKEGDKHQIYCHSFSPVTWKHSDHLHHNVEHGNSNVLSIKKVLIINSGIYTCEGNTNNGSYFYSESSLIVKGTSN